MADDERAEGACTFLIQRPDKSWTYCGKPAPSIWVHSAAGRYYRCGWHQPSQFDRLFTEVRRA